MSKHPTAATDSALLIAIDGPAGAGKSSVAARLAARLGLPYLDTGAMYRAVALLALRDGLSVPLGDEDASRVSALMKRHKIDVASEPEGMRISVDGDDVTSEIRTPECSLMASAVSALPQVRRALVPMQRRLGEARGGVMEGRDIGTVVFPDAQLKVFLTADADERARRRHLDLLDRNVDASLADVLAEQDRRDRQDTSRANSPLQVARGSVVVDTSGLTLEEVVERLFEEVGKKLRQRA
ncbi:MAG: (d)CMP kinase [Thermoanaerobaculales bacterium]